MNQLKQHGYHCKPNLVTRLKDLIRVAHEHLGDHFHDPIQELNVWCLSSDEQLQLNCISQGILPCEMLTEVIRDKHASGILYHSVNVPELRTILTNISSIIVILLH